MLLSLQALLQEPQPDDPQDAVVARQVKRSRKKYESTARYWTYTYAMPASTVLPDDLKPLDEMVTKYMSENANVTREIAIQRL